ncbi:Sporulation related domain-containing protein [Bosea sp. CRIB-10]|uniref:SPOR domain-containing protein n=1 Tax=Bosea sp. CRIB-10 TaxID=378404 RepID=UPI0008E972DF|nr:SPOR domain-containing protein [Bosea sp. CRIB-10]SFD34637.1 Sporulation related domain-containing protein [Bosea sp. CRIB-10]
MSEPARNRFALDLDDLERQLRGAAQPQKPGAASDPLMELTRLVGQDDPLKELFAGRSAEQARPAAPAAPQPVSWAAGNRTEPSFQPTLVTTQPVQSAPPPADVRGALDEFEALLRRTEPVRTAPPQPAAKAPMPPAHEYDEPLPAPAHAQPYAMQAEGAHAYVPEQPRDLDEAAGQVHAYQPQPAPSYQQAEPDYDAQQQGLDDEPRDFRRSRSRKGMLTAAALVIVAVGGVGAAMVFRNGKPAGVNGQPPVIAADTGPSKVAPVNPGGAEIPNQNKQIYERSGDASADRTKVVSREEQPVDVEQAARSMAPRPTQPSNGSITPTDTAAAALAPTEPGLVPIPAVPGLGEPRKVRTVAIRPDGTPAVSDTTANGAGQGIVTGSAPASRPTTPAPATQAQAASRPQQPSATPAAAPKTQERAAAPATPPASQTPPAAATRTAALAPQQQTQPAAAGPRTDPNGGFAVQLGAPGSEAEARATFAALQRKYPDQLSGQSPIIRKTELAGGKTVYRLRVGPYAREDASSMCSALQAAGGQCFIAKN